MELTAPFAFVRASGERWDVPIGAKINGASIPRLGWIFGPPYVGNYRRASVVHDYYCETESRDCDETHRIFYEGCRTDGVNKIIAKKMYAAVKLGGPKWSTAPRDLELLSVRGLERISKGDRVNIPPIHDIETLNEVLSWIEEEDPSLDILDIKTEALRSAQL